MSQVAEEIAISPPPQQNGYVLCTCCVMHFIRNLTDLPDCILPANEVAVTPAPALRKTVPERLPHLCRQLWLEMRGSGPPLSHQLTSEPIAERSSEDLNEGIRGGMHQRREGGEGCGGNEWEWMTRGFQYNVIKAGGDKGWWSVRRQHTA